MSSDDLGTRLEPRAPGGFEPIVSRIQNGLPPAPTFAAGAMQENGVVMFSPNTRQPEPAPILMKPKPMAGSAAAMLARSEEVQRTRQQELGRKYFRLIDESVRRLLTDDEVITLEQLGKATSLNRFLDQYLQHARESLAAETLLRDGTDFTKELQKLDAEVANIDKELQALFQKLNERAAPIHAKRDSVQRQQLARISAEQTMRSWQEILTCARIEVPIVEHRGTYDVLHPRNEMGR